MIKKGLVVIVGIVAMLFFAFSTNADAVLVGHWTMDDDTNNTIVVDSTGTNTGTFNDATGNSNTSAHSVPSGNPPYLNGALTFDGTDDYVDCGNEDSLKNFTEKTLLLWVKAPGFTGIDTRYIYDDSGVFDGGDAIRLEKSTNRLTVYLGDVYGTSVKCAMDFTPDEWFMVGYSWDGTEVKYYMNGSHVVGEDDDFTGLDCSDKNLFLGRFHLEAGYFFDGALDDVRVYNHALDSTEIKTLYDNAMIPEPSALLLLGSGLLGLILFGRKLKS